MAITSGAHAHASQLEALGAEMAGYKREREKVMAKIEWLEQQQHTPENEKKLESLQQEKQSLLDLIKELQEEKNLLLGSSAAAAAAGAGAAAAACVDDGLGTWAQELTVMAAEAGSCLSQPACQPKLPPQLRSGLYIRRCYCRLFDVLWHNCKAGKAGEQRGFVVTGTPGVGKSAFALFLIQQLGKKQQVVFYEHQDVRTRRRVWLKFDFRDLGRVVAQHTQLPLQVPDSDLCSDQAWLIIEGTPPKLEFSGDTKTVVLSSPNYGNFTTWLKGKYARPPLYMPTWSLQELQACREQLYPAVTADTAAERYSWLGGSIRHVLVKTDTDPQSVVLAAVHRQKAKQLVQAISKAFTWQSDFPHTLGHFQVAANFSVRYVTFASPRIADRVLEALAAEQKEKLQRFLVASQDSPDLGSLRGVLFERHGHKVLQAGGITCRWRQLQPRSTRKAAASSADVVDVDEREEQQQQHGGEEEEEKAGSHHFAEMALWSGGLGDLEQQLLQQQQVAGVQQQFQQLGLSSASEYVLPSGLELRWWDSGEQWLADLSRSSKAYVMPRSSNNAAWDAIALGGPCHVPLILQYTVSRSHGIKAQPVEVLLGRLNPDMCSAARLVFVVPPDVFDTFPWQPWQTAQGKVMKKVPSALQKLQQWVMELQVRPSPRSSSSSGGAGSSGPSSGRDSGGGALT